MLRKTNTVSIILSTLLLISAVIASWRSAAALGADESSEISAEELKAMIEQGRDFILLDVRTEAEFNQGHLPGAINFPLQILEDSLGGLDPAKEIVVYCRSGRRSTKASAILQEHGFELVRNYKGSWIDWTERGYPVAR